MRKVKSNKFIIFFKIKGRVYLYPPGKNDAVTPLTVETELENDDIICASGDSLFGNPGIAGRDYEED